MNEYSNQRNRNINLDKTMGSKYNIKYPTQINVIR